jgi:transcriptional regulator with XRE-family HTH domain
VPRSNPIGYSPVVREAARLLGAQIRAGRLERRWTLNELAERVGVTRVTMGKVERGDLSVRLGTALEAAALVGVPLFEEDERLRRLEVLRAEDRLALLPRNARRRVKLDNDF